MASNYSKEQIGIFYALAAFVFWGLIPIYFKQVASVNPFEVLLHRVIWSVLVLFILLYISKQFHLVKEVLTNLTQLKYLLLSSFFVSLNWLIFIYGVSSNKILETSLGYFINPLISILLGFLFFSEKLNKNQLISIIIVIIAVIVQIISVGNIPLISLGLAFSFALYGVVRKKLNIASLPGLFIETIIMLPFALFYFYYLITNHTSSFVNDTAYITLMLSLGGIITVLPLIWFNAAITRINLSTLGMLQYTGPTISFVIAILLYDEVLTNSKIITFLLIWIALAIFSYDTFKKKNTSFNH